MRTFRNPPAWTSAAANPYMRRRTRMIITPLILIGIQILVGIYGTNKKFGREHHIHSSTRNKGKASDVVDSPTLELVSRRLPPPTRIAFISAFIRKEMGPAAPYLQESYFPHVLNKACYANYWGYDFIFDQRWQFSDDYRARNQTDCTRSWLDFGNWHRVPLLQKALESDMYDWIFWTDVDYVVNQMTIPLETVFAEMHQHGLENIHLILPHDGNTFVFSSFAVLIRNSDFGRQLLQNWMSFGRGLCANGNYPMKKGCGNYDFPNSDQVGLWHSIPKTYSDWITTSDGGRNTTKYDMRCNEHTGYFNSKDFGLSEFDNYFHQVGMVKDSNYSRIPKDQPILWSAFKEKSSTSRNGIGVNLEVPNGLQRADVSHVFGLHKKRKLPPNVLEANENCKTTYGCYVRHDEHNQLLVGCQNKSFAKTDYV